MNTRRVSRAVAYAAWIIAVAVLGPPMADAQNAPTPSADEIMRKLAPAPLVRSVRGVTVAPGKEAGKPAIDLYINFEFDSAVLKTDGILVLQSLAVALKDPRLVNYRFEIAGHTDAVGTIEYNQKLSEARAKAVIEYLFQYHKLLADRLVPVGFGKSRPLDASRPNDGINRRVQITNIGE